jgi:hypothetical protein
MASWSENTVLTVEFWSENTFLHANTTTIGRKKASSLFQAAAFSNSERQHLLYLLVRVQYVYSTCRAQYILPAAPTVVSSFDCENSKTLVQSLAAGSLRYS